MKTEAFPTYGKRLYHWFVILLVLFLLSACGVVEPAEPTAPST
jgi:predicted small lipoprotein YifL